MCERGCEFKDLKERFLCYVNKVRQLRNDDDNTIINENVLILEKKLRAMKESYETQISQLSMTLNSVMTQKIAIERKLTTCKDNEVRLADRLAVENMEATRLEFEQSCLRRDVASKEKESISISLAIKELKQAGSENDNADSILRIDLDNSYAKNAYLEVQMRNYENNISSLTQKIEFQDHFFSKKLEDMKGNLEERTQGVVQMDNAIRVAKDHETQWPLILEEVHKGGKDQYLRFKSEAEEYFDGRLSHVQQLLDTETADNVSLRRQNGHLSDEYSQMQRMQVELRSKEEHLERQKNILEESLQMDKEDNERTILSLQQKIERIQDDFLGEMEEKVRAGEGQESVEISGEMAFFERLLVEEEKRFNIRARDGGLIESEARGNEQENGREDSYEDKEQAIGKTIELAGRENDASGHGYDKLNGCMVPTGYRTLDETRDAMGASVGTVVDPALCLSSTPCPSVSTPPNFIATRPQTVICQKGRFGRYVCAENTIDTDVDTRKEAVRPRTVNNDESVKVHQALTMEVDRHGRYIRVSNCSDSRAADLGRYTIQQTRFGHPFVTFQFPDQVMLAPNSSVKVWAGSNDPMCHCPPKDFYCEESSFWAQGPEYRTLLLRPHDRIGLLGDAASERLVCSIQQHRVQPGTLSAHRTKLPELTTHYRTVFSEQLFLERRDDTSTLSHPIYHPYTSSTKSSTHPCIENNRGKTAGNDNSSFNRQTRQLTDGVPDSMIGHPYTGNSTQRMVGSARVMRLGRGHCSSGTVVFTRGETSKQRQKKQHIMKCESESGVV